MGHINPKCGAEPEDFFYTHISNQYMPFSTKAANVSVRGYTCVPGCLPHQESNLAAEGNYTDTADFTDHVFALMLLIGF